LRDGYGDVIRDNAGVPVKTRDYHYIDNRGSGVIIQEHSLGHSKAAPFRGAEPHFNIRPANNPKTGSVDGTHGHYNFFLEV
jgi:hypothetical protein